MKLANEDKVVGHAWTFACPRLDCKARHVLVVRLYGLRYAEGPPTVHARNRIGEGPWRNALGDVVAADVESLHENGIEPERMVDEAGDALDEEVPGPGHDILTGSREDGSVFAGRTCMDWSSNDRADRAQVGHHDHSIIPDPISPNQNWNCVSSRSGCTERTLDAILDPGNYFLVVEGTAAGGYDYELAIHRETPGTSCASARDITRSGRVSGDTTGAGDDFRSSDACGDGAGPDDVWRIVVETEGFFSADFVFPGTFSNALIALRAECGGEAIRQHNSGVSWTVEPGTYFLTIDGADADNFGAYQIDITMP